MLILIFKAAVCMKAAVDGVIMVAWNKCSGSTWFQLYCSLYNNVCKKAAVCRKQLCVVIVKEILEGMTLSSRSPTSCFNW